MEMNNLLWHVMKKALEEEKLVAVELKGVSEKVWRCAK